jgi:hypothetical protein
MVLIRKGIAETLSAYITHAKNKRDIIIRNLIPKNINFYILLERLRDLI